MRIGIDAGCWTNRRGYGRYARELSQAMVEADAQDDFVFFADEQTAAEFPIGRPNVRVVPVRQAVSPAVAAASGTNRSPVDLLRFSRMVARERPDVLWFPSVYSFFPVPPGVPCVVTVHDVIPERFPELTLPTIRDRLLWQAKVRLALFQARLVLTVSEYSKQQIAQVLRVPESKIYVTLEAPAAVYRPVDSKSEIAECARSVGLPAGARWFIYVGGFNPHKHVDRIIRSFASLTTRLESDHEVYLLLVGPGDADAFHHDIGTLRELTERLGISKRVLWPGYLPDEELRLLYAGAVAALLMSGCEGFGLPAVEAAACGTPVIATTESPLPRLLEGGGIFLEPGDQGGLADAMWTLFEDRQKRNACGRR
ncbi:MAG: glycosyltransferase family 1 protein, partial [Candidatus Dadabacteria bacterium]